MKSIIMGLICLMLPLSGFSAEKLKVYANDITTDSFVIDMINGFQRSYGVFTVFDRKSAIDDVIGSLVKGQNNVGIGDRIAFRNNVEDGTWSMQVAWSALVFIVNEDNPIKNISTAQAKKILTGQIRNWKYLGGEDVPITLYLRKGVESGIGFSSRALLFGKIKQKFYHKAFKKNSSIQIRKAVKKDRYSFAIDDLALAREYKGIKVLKLDGTRATSRTILNKKYKLARQFYIYTRGRPYGTVIKFITYARSHEGQELIQRMGLVGFKYRNGRKHFNQLLDMVLEQ